MRLYRAVRNDPPTEADFQSPWEQGRHPPKPQLERAWKAVSTFRTFDKAVDKAIQYDLGDFIAELDVPDSVQKQVNATGHADLENATPGELLGYVVQIAVREARVRT